MEQKNHTESRLKGGESAFLIRILFRQNATWMGEVQWLDGEKKLYFRSLLELVMLMQEALDTSDTPPADYSVRNWGKGEEAAL